LPTEEEARIALRTQQILAHESGVPDTADPLVGSYFVETLTNQLEEGAWGYFDKIDSMGGMIEAIETGCPKRRSKKPPIAIRRPWKARKRSSSA
ncbi:MAG: methylmalonyl-CoA mutase family protein, partial [Acidobacteria bacterium]|nr:methylmalonyl-CoA mutase family protein [Acidobacteriota bacterium]